MYENSELEVIVSEADVWLTNNTVKVIFQVRQVRRDMSNRHMKCILSELFICELNAGTVLPDREIDHV